MISCELLVVKKKKDNNLVIDRKRHIDFCGDLRVVCKLVGMDWEGWGVGQGRLGYVCSFLLDSFECRKRQNFFVLNEVPNRIGNLGLLNPSLVIKKG